MLVQIGEWVPADVLLGATFVIPLLGVVGLGWWVLRGDSRNRRAEKAAEDSERARPEH